MVSRRTLLASLAAVPLLPLAPAPASSAAAAVNAQGVVRRDVDVVYGEADGQPLLLNIHRPASRDDLRPAVILIHGGGWTQGYDDRNGMEQPARDLAAADYVAFNVAYRLMDGTPGYNVWPAQLDDVQLAVRWIRANAEEHGVDPERIGSYGFSAGGQLAAMLGLRDTRDDDAELADYSSRVACVVSLAGNMDLTLPLPADPQIYLTFLGGTREEEPDAYRDASPLAWVNADSAPFLILHGAADDINPPEHARRMVDALQEAGVEVSYEEIPDADHFAVNDWSIGGTWILDFLADHLQPER
jgi:acetyl esterase/lipase